MHSVTGVAPMAPRQDARSIAVVPVVQNVAQHPRVALARLWQRLCTVRSSSPFKSVNERLD